MNRQSVVICVDVSVDWQGDPPNYRVYVGDEMFTERTWIWTENYLEEQLQILVEPGEYQIHYELVDAEDATLTANNYRITHGSASVNHTGCVTVQESSYENA